MPSNSNHNYAFDFLRAISILGVIIMHSSAYPLTLKEINFRTYEWNVYTILYNSFYWAVPIFFMLSGALLLGRKESIKKFYTKRFIKIGVPLFFWSTFYLSVYCLLNNCSADYVINRLVSGTPFYHMWFLFALIGLYLLTPLIQKVYFNIGEIEKKIYLIGLTLYVFFTEIVNSHILHQTYSIFQLFILYIPYYVMGFFLSTFLLKQSKSYIVIFLLGLVLIIFVNFLFSRIYECNHFFNVHTNYLNPITFIVSSVLFLLVTAYSNVSLFQTRIIQEIADTSFGIYLVHPLYITLLNKFIKVEFIVLFPILTLMVYIFLVMLLSYTSVKILKKLPLVNHIV